MDFSTARSAACRLRVGNVTCDVSRRRARSEAFSLSAIKDRVTYVREGLTMTVVGMRVIVWTMVILASIDVDEDIIWDAEEVVDVEAISEEATIIEVEEGITIAESGPIDAPVGMTANRGSTLGHEPVYSERRRAAAHGMPVSCTKSISSPSRQHTVPKEALSPLTNVPFGHLILVHVLIHDQQLMHPGLEILRLVQWSLELARFGISAVVQNRPIVDYDGVVAMTIVSLARPFQPTCLAWRHRLRCRCHSN